MQLAYPDPGDTGNADRIACHLFYQELVTLLESAEQELEVLDTSFALVLGDVAIAIAQATAGGLDVGERVLAVLDTHLT